jgi:SH3 domain-containing YSC84-like protein 1
MRINSIGLAACVAIAAPLFAQTKEDERLQNSAVVLQEVQAGGLPTSVLDKAVCVVVFPSVKKVAIGIGGSYGRGEMVCRTGAQMDGSWGAPVMYSLDQESVGVQLGSTATDFVLVVMNQNGANQVLNGKTKIGSNASAAAGPSAQATSWTSDQMRADILTYTRSKGVFAGVSLEGASMEMDKDANKAVYGKVMTASEIESGHVPAAAQSLISLLNQISPTRK